MLNLAILYSDFILLAAILAVAALLALIPPVRAAVLRVTQFVLVTVRATAAMAACVMDRLLPVGVRKARASRAALILWCLVNLAAPLAAATGLHLGIADRQLELALVTATLGGFNLVFLTAAYFALKEGIDIMNNDVANRHRQFADLSTATNMTVVITVLVVAQFQLAHIQYWLQNSGGIALVRVHSGVGVGFLDHLIAVVAALPGVSFAMALTGVADRVTIEPGLGTVWARFITTFGSLLFFSTVFGFFQHYAALRAVIERFLRQPEGTPTEEFLRTRLERAPSIVKHYLGQAYKSEINDIRRVRILALALDKHSYRAPVYFLRSYGTASPVVREQGAVLVAAFLESKRHKLESRGVAEIVAAARAAIAVKAFEGPGHAARAGAILLPCLECLSNPKSSDAATATRGLVQVREPAITSMLLALQRTTADAEIRQRAAYLLKQAAAAA